MIWPALETIGLIITILVLWYYYAMSKLEFWQKRGVKGPKPIPLFGNFLDVFLGKASITDCFVKVYHDYKDEPVIGLYRGHVPLLVVKDPELMKDILIKDFSNFADRMLPPNRNIEPLSEHLFRLNAERWKPLRAKLSPVFSSGKLKDMFPLLLECSDHFVKYVETLALKGEPIECREISAKYTTDVIGSCAFGVEANALASEDTEFRKMGRKIFETNLITMIRDSLRSYPFLYRLIGPYLFPYEIVDFFLKITRETMDYRIKHNVCRHDFIDALIDLKKHPDKIDVKEVDDLYLTAQAFIFFTAGFETSSVTIANTLYELALHPSIQEKVRAEIKNVLQKTNGTITYDCIREMKYLDACFQETLRKYPVVLWLSRMASNEYTFRGTKITIPKGQMVFLPLYAIQRDPEIYPNPDTFDPERFMNDNAKNRHPMHFLPFGDGPRNCIAARFAKNQTKVGLINLLSKFKVEECQKTCKNYNINKKPVQPFLLQPTHGLYVKMSHLEV